MYFLQCSGALPVHLQLTYHQVRRGPNPGRPPDTGRASCGKRRSNRRRDLAPLNIGVFARRGGAGSCRASYAQTPRLHAGCNVTAGVCRPHRPRRCEQRVASRAYRGTKAARDYFLAAIRSRTCSGVNGCDVTVVPSGEMASFTAVQIAAAAPTVPASPTPRAPKVVALVGVSM